MSEFHGVDLALALRSVQKGELVKPVLQNFLHEAEYPEHFEVHFRKGDNRRPADGWFWPSTHPTWPRKALYLYLTDPQALPHEERRYMNTLSLTMGSAVHGFIEMCLTVLGLRPADMNRCTSCPPEKKCTEPGFADPDAQSRGHMDGLLDLDSLKPDKAEMAYPGFEFKTLSNINRLKRLEAEGVAFYRSTWPDYFAQNQEYMRLSGRRSMVVLFMQMAYPWTMVELHVPYDPVAANLVRDKYLSVREDAERTIEPACCGRKACFLAGLCGVKTTKREGAAEGTFLMRKDGTIGIRR